MTKPKKITEWGNTLKLEASFALERLSKRLLTAEKVYEVKQITGHIKRVSKILRQSAVGEHKLEGVRVRKLKHIAPIEREDEGVLRNHSLKT